MRSQSVSVIVISLNEGEYLQRTVDSLRPTLPPGGEVIVVDDGSTDGSTDFLRPFRAPISRMRKSAAHRTRVRPAVHTTLLRPAERLGVARARNFGAHHAHNDVVVFSDGHVEVPMGWYGPLVVELNNPKVGAVAPGISIMQPAPVASTGYGLKWKDATLDNAWLGRQGNDAHPVPLLGGGFIAMRRDTFDAIGGFDSGMVIWGAEDSELCVRLWTLGYECLVVPAVDVAHRFRPQHPYRVAWEEVIHNKLRLAALHFGPERMSRVAGRLRQNAVFAAASTRLASSDVQARRSELDALRVQDDDWFFSRFSRELQSELSAS